MFFGTTSISKNQSHIYIFKRHNNCKYFASFNSAWSEDGCFVDRTNRTHTICMCNHLTNFAILMDVVDDSNGGSLLGALFTDDVVLCVIYGSVIGCVLLVGAALLVLRFFQGTFVKVRASEGQDSCSQNQQQQQSSASQQHHQAFQLHPLQMSVSNPAITSDNFASNDDEGVVDTNKMALEPIIVLNDDDVIGSSTSLPLKHHKHHHMHHHLHLLHPYQPHQQLPASFTGNKIPMPNLGQVSQPSTAQSVPHTIPTQTTIKESNPMKLRDFFV